MPALLSVRGLTTSFATEGGVVRAIDGVSFDLAKGGTLALVGESGSGKTTVAQSILRLVPPRGTIDAGRVVFDGQSLTDLPEAEMRARRGRFSMVFQDPTTSLNPVSTVGSQIADVISLHQKTSRHDAREKAFEMLDRLGIAAPRIRMDAYPHQLSAGMRQRVTLAMALATEPDLLIADDPTSLVDVATQADILDVLRQLQETRGLGILLLTRDFGLAAEAAQHLAVMLGGRIVERGPVRELFTAPKHPYTEALLKTLRRPGEGLARGRPNRPARLRTVEGNAPDAIADGCRFASRCPYAEERCRREEPSLSDEDARSSRCFFPERVGAGS